MSATIIDFSDHQHRSKRDDRHRAARERIDNEKRHAVERLRKHLKTPGQRGRKIRRKLSSGELAIRLAQRLGEDLETLRQQERGCMKRVLDEARILKTNRARYALFAGEVADPADRILRLHTYVKLADEIARVLGHDPDLYLHDVLQGLGILEVAGQPEDDDASELSMLLDRMARHVACVTDLLSFFDRAARTPGTIDANGRKIHPSTMTVLRDRGMEGGIDHYTETQPLPNVPLFRLLERDIPTTVRVGPTFADTASLQSFLAGPRKGFRRTTLPATVEIWREIGITVAERSGRGSIGALFSGRAHVRLRIDGTSYESLFPWSLDTLLRSDERGKLPAIVLDGTKGAFSMITALVNMDIEWNDCWIEPAAPEGREEPPPVEHYYFSYHAVEPWTVRRLLDWAENRFVATELLLPEEPVTLVEFRLGGRIGRAVEQALMSGSLERKLIEVVGDLSAELNRHDQVRRETLRTQDEAAFARWSQSEGDNDND